MGHVTFLTKINMSRGFLQISIERKVRNIPLLLTFHTVWNVLPFGLSNPSATFSRLVAKLLIALDDFADHYMDDIIL